MAPLNIAHDAVFRAAVRDGVRDDRRPDDGRRRARWLLLEHVLQRLDDALDEPVLLVKGGALVEQVYAAPWLRPMSDIDLLVARAPSVVAALAGVG
ncbi:MAG: nucleotidyltransferase family protein, partial [Myxococcota bacterium]